MGKYYYTTSDVSRRKNNQKNDTLFVQYKYEEAELGDVVFIVHKIKQHNLDI